MKIIKYFAMAVIVLAMTSCGKEESKDSDSITLEVEEVNMGSFSNYGKFSEEIKLKLDTTVEKSEDGAKYVASIPLTIKSDIAWKYNLEFRLVVADEDHSKIKDLGYLYIHGEYDHETESDYKNYLISGDIRQDFGIRLSDAEWKAIKDNGKYLIIECKTSSEYISSHEGSMFSETDMSEDELNDDNSSLSSDSEDWDSVLDSYEQYVNKYVSLAKKAAKGDMSAMSEYPSLMEKAQELSDKLSNAKSEMTSSQQSRYMKITQKMANMAASL